MKKLTEKDWVKAKAYLDEAIAIYESIPTGALALSWIRPLGSRLDNGERTEDLYEEIWGISL